MLHAHNRGGLDMPIAATRACRATRQTRESLMHRARWMALAAIVVLTAATSAFAQGRWSSLKPIPQGEEEVYGTAADGKLYVLGGLGIFPGWEPKQMLWSFDPATNDWTRLPNIPEGIHHPGFAAAGGKL